MFVVKILTSSCILLSILLLSVVDSNSLLSPLLGHFSSTQQFLGVVSTSTNLGQFGSYETASYSLVKTPL